MPSAVASNNFDQLQLLFQVRPAGFDLVGKGVTVTGRAALDRVRYVEVLPCEPHLFQYQAVQELPGAPDEG